MDDDRLLALARELEWADERVAAAIAEAVTLENEAGAVGSRAAGLENFLERLPAELEAAAAGLAEAAADQARKDEDLVQAELELAAAAQAEKDERLAAARRAVVRTRDAAAMARKRVERAREARRSLEREAEGAAGVTAELERRGHELSERVGRLERISAAAAAPPAPGLRGLVDWAARVRTALFVVRGGLETERERIVREANELGASALGEPVVATSVSLVRRRLERGR